MSDTGHLLVLNRFDDEFGEYHRYLRPDTGPVLYIALPDATGPLRPRPQDALVTVGELTDVAVRQAVAAAGVRVGAVVGLSEFDLQLAARCREHFGTGGPGTAFVARFRDKVLMKDAVGAAGLAVPRALRVAPETTVSDVLAAIPLPCVVKPVDGAASAGVEICTTAAQLAAALASAAGDVECEEYVDGPIFHVDGVVRDGVFGFATVSRYVGTCLAFRHGAPLGSFWLGPGPERDSLERFALDCVRALGLRDGVVHLEAIRRRSGGEPVFLEVGLRPGGGEILFLHEELYGVDLMAESFHATLGQPATMGGLGAAPRAGGFVMIPEPVDVPVVVTGRPSLIGTVDGVYAEVLPEVGSVLDGTGGYERIGGRFRLRGRNAAEVASTVARVIELYRLRTKPAVTA